MKKPWSLSTTVRNPERTIHFLSTLKKLEGKKFDRKTQIQFQIMLIQDKHYRPTNLTNKEKEYFETDKEMSLVVAKKVFDNQKYMDPPMRGRQSFAILRKMCLCTGSANASIRITQSGNELLSPANDIGDSFFNYFLKWQLPNPMDSRFTEDGGFMVVPFIATLHLIHEVNTLYKNLGKNPVGLSKKEFALFVPTLIDYQDIKTQAKRIIEYRQKPENDKETYELEFLGNFLQNRSLSFISKLKSNLKDYGDNTIRYFRLTRYIRIRGNGFFVDLEPRRMIEISELLNSYKAAPRQMNTAEDYVKYVADKQQPRLPWRKKETLQRIHEFLQNEIRENVKPLKELQIPIPDMPDLRELDFVQQNDILKSYLLELQNMQQYYEMGNVASITQCINVLNDIRNTSNKPSVELEKQAALSFMALNDAIKIKPNYPIGDDGEPTFTAPSGVSDLECYYKQFNLVCEVTMLTTRSQWVNEGQPVMRHLREFEESNEDKTSYCMFIAPKIHTDTANTFWNAVKYEYRGKSQKIIPLTITLFVKLLKILHAYKTRNNVVFPHTELMNLYDGIVNLVQNVPSSDNWIEEIPNEIHRWEECILKQTV